MQRFLLAAAAHLVLTTSVALAASSESKPASESKPTSAAKPASTPSEKLPWKFQSLTVEPGQTRLLLRHDTSDEIKTLSLLPAPDSKATQDHLISVEVHGNSRVVARAKMDGKVVLITEGAVTPFTAQNPSGPSAEDRHRYESLSEAGREKLRNRLREKFSHDEFRNKSEEERRHVIRELFDKIEKEDRIGPK